MGTTIDVSTALSPIPELDKLYDDFVTEIQGKIGEPVMTVRANQMRNKVTWSAVWFVDGSNNGFSIDLESPTWIELEAWSHSGDMIRSRVACRTFQMAEGMLLTMLPPELGLIC